MQLIKVPDWLSKMPVIKKFRLTGADLKKQTKGGSSSIQIISEAADKNSKSIDDWRTALQVADAVENPKWNLLQDLFDYLRIDAHTHSLIELRKTATLSTRYFVYDKITGEEQPEKTALLQTEWFYKFVSMVLESRVRGYMVTQLIDPATMKFAYIPYRNYVPQRNMVLLKVSDDKGVELDQPALMPYFIVVKDDYPYGYMNDVVPLILWKLNVMMSWAEATEKYGIPPLIATTKQSDDKSISKIMDMLQNAGESLRTVLPEGTTVQVMQNAEKIDPEKMFKGLINTCDDQISKRLVGGTMITDNGSSRSQSEVHQGNFDTKIVESDKRIVEFVVTGQLLPMMMRFGYGFTENDRFGFDRNVKLSPKDQADIFDIVSKHYEVDEEWIRKNLQVPIIGKKTTSADTNFKPAVTALAAALTAKGVMLPKYVITNCCKQAVTAIGIDSILEELSIELLNNVWKGKDTLTAEVLKAISTYKHLYDGLQTAWEGFANISYDAPDVHALAYMEYNLFEFSRLKEKANVLALNQLLLDTDNKKVKTFDEFKSKAIEYLNQPDINWLRTEYNHTIAVGQNSSRYFQFKKEAKTVTRWLQYQTVGDSRVRPAHQILNGKIFNIEEKGGLTIVPPNDWGCRCELIQYLGNPDDSMKMSNAEGLQKLGINADSPWNINRADAKQVFTANEMYANKLDLKGESKKLDFATYGLKKWEDVKSNYSSLKLDETITPDNVNELFKPIKNKDFMGYEDYLGRKLQLTKQKFDQHTSGDYTSKNKNRHQLFPHIEDVLANPDEVYFFQYANKTPQTKYIKFYNNEVIVVNTSVGSTGVEINTWFANKAEDTQYRNGYLIYTKKPL